MTKFFYYSHALFHSNKYVKLGQLKTKGVVRFIRKENIAVTQIMQNIFFVEYVD